MSEPAIHPEVRHEPSDVGVRGVLWFAAGLVVFALVLHFALTAMFNRLAAREDARKASTFPLAGAQREQGRILPPTPRLDGIDLKPSAAAPQDPGEYGWIDERAGIVRIPVERAMERALSEGRFQARPGEHRWRGRLDDLPSDASSGRRTWGGQR